LTDVKARAPGRVVLGLAKDLSGDRRRVAFAESEKRERGVDRPRV